MDVGNTENTSIVRVGMVYILLSIKDTCLHIVEGNTMYCNFKYCL